ncbi:avidin-like isoform X2 [Carettochelys insculpta]|uniref:avidin-like isoform X2 n=1 Tax=Carettochelys insculpta TaxID=44489 RepID=UPI003EB7B4FD
MGKSNFSLILTLALMAVGSTSERKCELSGLWRNDLGSLMEIYAVNSTGEFSGEYLTSVTATSSCILRSPLKGAQHSTQQRAQPVFGFTVNWENFSNSTTVFVGQCFVDEKRKEILRTMWLLREHVGSLGDNWRATRRICSDRLSGATANLQLEPEARS